MPSKVTSSMSPPPTPSAEAPAGKQCRFKDTGYPTEWAEDYRPGGFHPVHIGDKFSDGRYRVIRKLGEGSFSTVWLAVDSKTSDFVALKIMSAKASKDAEKEVSIYTVIREKASGNNLSEHVALLYDTFEVTGPNGVHRVLVFPPMGPSAASMLTVLTGDRKPKRGQPPRYPKAIAKAILKHALSGLAFLHQNGIVHGDVQPGNLLFSISDLKSTEEQRLAQDVSKTTQPLERKDGKVDRWAPEYLALGQSLAQLVDLEKVLDIKVSDLGAAFYEKQPPASTVTPVALRAPELILGEKFGSSIDIWAFGCLMYEFITGSKLFSVILMGDDKPEDADDDHILDLIDVLGPLPEHLMAKWPRKDKYIGPSGERLQPEDDFEDDFEDNEGDDDVDADDFDDGIDDKHEALGVRDGADKQDGPHADVEDDSEYDDERDLDVDGQSLIDVDIEEDLANAAFTNDSLEDQFAKKNLPDIDEDERDMILSLIRQILQYDPSKRPTAIQLLQHPWFQD